VDKHEFPLQQNKLLFVRTSVHNCKLQFLAMKAGRETEEFNKSLSVVDWFVSVHHTQYAQYCGRELQNDIYQH
jgi:hypothetical protein